MVPINYLSVLGAAVASMILGFLWYGPLFGKEWARLMGFTTDKMDAAKKKGMGKSYAIMAVGSLLMSYALAHNLIFGSAYLQMSGIEAGIMAGFWNWLGFIAPVTVGVVLWEGKPWKLWCITAGYYLVTLLVMGMILAM